VTAGASDIDGETGLAGPVCVSAAALLLAIAPLMRGGNRYPALIALEALALAVLVAMAWRWRPGAGLRESHPASRIAMAILLASPVWLAFVYLVPLPPAWWFSLPGRAVYQAALNDAGAAAPHWRPLSVVPIATWTSLLAGIPLLAAFLAGRWFTLAQLRVLAWTLLPVAAAEILLGLLQLSGGSQSPLYFDAAVRGRPIGSFANSNHLANWLGMVLMLTLWLALEYLSGSTAGRHWRARSLRLAPGHSLIGWSAAVGLLLLGIVTTLSRGAVLGFFPVVGLAVLWAVSRAWRDEQRSRRLVLLALAAAIGALLLLGLGALLVRFSPGEITSSASFRALIARSSLEGALAFWPLGAGWGTFPDAYPRFQPADVPGYVGHAHMDYVEMLFDGGVFFLLLAAAFTWLAARRAVQLTRLLWGRQHVRRETVAVLLCGLGLLGFLAHSLVEFNMRIPANAILAALLAGVYLRPMPAAEPDA
jgi:hypothetical protein